MIEQSLKDLYYVFARVACLPSHGYALVRYRIAGSAKGLRLHVGCGDHYIPGFVNIDGNFRRRKDLWLDLRNGLPFPSRSVDSLYCCHTLEHLYPSDAVALLGEVRRVLAEEGIARIAVPSFEHALRIASGEFTDTWPREFRSSSGQAINYLFCDGQHRYAYSLESITELCGKIGFTRVRDRSGEAYSGADSGLAAAIAREPPGSLVVELSP